MVIRRFGTTGGTPRDSGGINTWSPEANNQAVQHPARFKELGRRFAMVAIGALVALQTLGAPRDSFAANGYDPTYYSTGNVKCESFFDAVSGTTRRLTIQPPGMVGLGTRSAVRTIALVRKSVDGGATWTNMFWTNWQTQVVLSGSMFLPWAYGMPA